MTATLARARPAVRGGRFWAAPAFWYGVFALNFAAICWFWWAGTGSQPLKTPGDAWNDAGRITALIGTYLILWQLVLLARVPWLEEAFGLEQLARLHRWNAYPALGLLVAHAVFQTIGYQLADNTSTLAQLGDFVTGYTGVLAAFVALALMVGVVAASITAARRHLAYETWYFIHLYAYLAVALAFLHELAVGLDFIGNPGFTAYWWLLYAAVAAALLGFRVARPLALYRRHAFQVQRLQREAPGVVSVYVRGRDLDRFDVEAGQFLIWRFLDSRRWWQAHPFSLSAAPNGRQLRLTAKNIGDFTSRLSELRPGTPVLIEGPFGRFTGSARRRDKVLLVAGGVGVTPIRALAESLASEGADVRVLYRCHTQREVIFKEELERLREQLGVRVEYLLSDAPAVKGSGRRWFQPARLRKLVPDLSEREVYICGPPPMRESVVSALETAGVPREYVHTEVFRLQS